MKIQEYQINQEIYKTGSRADYIYFLRYGEIEILEKYSNTK
jgi:CRP-like cAMP-binding protein